MQQVSSGKSPPKDRARSRCATSSWISPRKWVLKKIRSARVPEGSPEDDDAVR